MCVGMGHINARSACDVSKSDQNKDLIIDSNLVRRGSQQPTTLSHLVSPPGYTMQQKRGGGVTLSSLSLYKQSISLLTL